MNAEELLVHDRSEGQCAERVYAGVVQALGILTLTYTCKSVRGYKMIANVKAHTQA